MGVHLLDGVRSVEDCQNHERSRQVDIPLRVCAIPHDLDSSAEAVITRGENGSVADLEDRVRQSVRQIVLVREVCVSRQIPVRVVRVC